METLACMSSRACPPCWHYRAGRCELTVQLDDVLAPAPLASPGPLLRAALA